MRMRHNMDNPQHPQYNEDNLLPPSTSSSSNDVTAVVNIPMEEAEGEVIPLQDGTSGDMLYIQSSSIPPQLIVDCDHDYDYDEAPNHHHSTAILHEKDENIIPEEAPVLVRDSTNELPTKTEDDLEQPHSSESLFRSTPEDDPNSRRCIYRILTWLAFVLLVVLVLHLFFLLLPR